MGKGGGGAAAGIHACFVLGKLLIKRVLRLRCKRCAMQALPWRAAAAAAAAEVEEEGTVNGFS
jgi:hypothetical protein